MTETCRFCPRGIRCEFSRALGSCAETEQKSSSGKRRRRVRTGLYVFSKRSDHCIGRSDGVQRLGVPSRGRPVRQALDSRTVFVVLWWAQTEGVALVDRIPARIPIQIQPTRQPNRVRLRELTRTRS